MLLNNKANALNLKNDIYNLTFEKNYLLNKNISFFQNE
jgi:hypothetical protein